MNLLIITQKCDIADDNLGFFHDWIEEFAKHYKKVIVICLWKGKYDLPENVRVLSLGKESGVSRLKYICNFYKYIWQERKNYDKVFVHMNQVYVVLGGLFWRFTGKKIALWFTHKSVTLSLRVAEKLAHVIFTASSESFRIKSKKLKIMGHGIDVDKFRVENKYREAQDVFNILSIGRISPAKDIKTLIKALDILNNNREIENKIRVKIVGGPIYRQDEIYFEELKEDVEKRGLNDMVRFIGAIPSNERYDYFKNADLLVHMSKTGSLDKVSLEAMASRTLIISCNDASREILKGFGDEFIYDIGDYKRLAENIEKVIALKIEDKEKISKKMQEVVINEHEIGGLIKKIKISY